MQALMLKNKHGGVLDFEQRSRSSNKNTFLMAIGLNGSTVVPDIIVHDSQNPC